MRPARARLASSIAIAALVGAVAAAPCAAASLSLSVAGNHFVDAAGRTVRLLGVDEESTEYACYYGYAYANVPLDAGDAAAIAAWGADAVRIPLNEDCWLGINGLPAGGLSAAGYQQAVEQYIGELNADGIYAILDLHWSAPGALQSDGQRPMPDDHSVAFWKSVAAAFQGDPGVVFDAFNEPYSPAADGWTGYPVSWSCWENGGCVVPADADGTTPHADPQTYTAVGMAALVDAIRDTGATQPIMLGGLSYANDLSGWLAHEPTDPAGRLAASFHNYSGQACDDVACWNATIAPLAAQVPVVTGEFGEDDCPSGGGTDPNNFDNSYMSWADANGVSYLAWGWLVLSSDPSCSSLTLLKDYAGSPADPNGVAVRDHLLALGAGSGPSGGTSPSGGTGATGASTGTGVVAPAAAGSALDGRLRSLVHRRAIRDANALLRRSGVTLRFTSTGPGRLTVAVRHGATGLASGDRTFDRAGTGAVTLLASASGRRLLSRRRHPLDVEVVAMFVPRAGAASYERCETTLVRSG